MRIHLGPLLLIFGLLGGSAQGRDLGDQIGIGFGVQNHNDLTTLSLKYHASKYVALNVVGGFHSGNSAMQLGMKAYRNVFLEENLNFSLGAAAFLVTSTTNGNTASGLELDALINAEFFLPGLYRLGFSLEGGIGLRTLGSVSIASFGGASLHYYF